MDDIIINGSVVIPFSSLEFKYSRSGGKGGQNVNKVSTKVELIFRPDEVRTDAKTADRIKRNLAAVLDTKGNLRIVSQESRSQWQNKQICVEKLRSIIADALYVPAYRVPTKPTKGSKQQRLSSKKIHSARKSFRSKKSFNDE